MKSYPNFTLKGRQFLPLWIAFFFFFVIPFYLLINELIGLTAAEVPAGGPPKIFYLYFMLVLTMAFTFIFIRVKQVFQSLEFKGSRIICDFHMGKYIGIIISGVLLSIVTIGIYVPWFIRNLHRFFVHGASYHAHKFAFMGKGRTLFLILTLTIFIPFLVVGFIVFTILDSDIEIWIYQVIVISSLVIIIYSTFKWLVEIRYKNYLIKLETGFFPAIGKIAIELVLAIILVFIFRWLSAVCIALCWNIEFFPETGKMVIELILAVITAGFYFPMAFIRLYRYFAEHTKSNIVEGKQITMGYDGDLLADFRYIWGQILLTVITLGIYYPWAFTRIVQRVLHQTYLTTDLLAKTGESGSEPK